MQVEVNGTRLWFDVDGPALVPSGSAMAQQPTVVLVHGGPGSYDHSYFKPQFTRLAERAQVVYLDLRGHGRSGRGRTADWSFEVCADDVRTFCDLLDITEPIVLGHSMGGFVAMLYGARHPGHAGALVLQSTMATFDLARLVAGVRKIAGDDVAALAERSYGGDPVSPDEWSRVFDTFGPHVPDDEQLARRTMNLELRSQGLALLRALDLVDQLRDVTSPTLVCVGELDPITPVAAAQEIVESLPDGVGRLAVIEGAGHFPWLDDPEAYWEVITGFMAHVRASQPEALS